jgi:hypothetical protein
VKFKETKSFIVYSIASAKSKGALLVSATDPIKNTIKIGNKGIINQIAL